MKKGLVFILVLIYGLSASGATVYLHYCCGKVDKITLLEPDKPLCPLHKEVMVKKQSQDCCKDQQVKIEKKADQYTYTDGHVLLSKIFPAVTLTCYSTACDPSVPVMEIAVAGADSSPPDAGMIPIYLLNRTYLI